MFDFLRSDLIFRKFYHVMLIQCADYNNKKNPVPFVFLYDEQRFLSASLIL